MSQRMFFDYELVLPSGCYEGDCYGKRSDDGTWSGVMGKTIFSCFNNENVQMIKV